MNNFDYLRVYESPWKKIRLGKNFDGGYIIADLDTENTYDVFLSGGIETDISFEVSFLEKYKNITCYAFDGTINNIPVNNITDNRLQFIKKNIGKINNNNISNLREYFDKYDNIFMKMDIEGGENDLFEALTDSDLLKIKQLVIEFHSAHQKIIPSRLEKTHWLIHFHANNCCGTTKIDNIDIPNVFECTYVRKNKDDVLKYNSRPIPDPELDQRNVLHNSEITLTGYPFVEKNN